MRERGETDEERAVLARIDAEGVHVVHALEPDGGPEPDLSYTVGLWATFGHAELAVVGPRAEERHALLGAAVARVRGGTALPPGGVLETGGRSWRTAEADDALRSRLRLAAWLYEGERYPLLRLVPAGPDWGQTP